MTAFTLTDLLLNPVLERAPAAPLFTYYDDADGTRVELSALTLANWAAKTANFLRDEAGLDPGALVAVLAPPHWQTVAALLGAWWAGAEVTLHADPAAEFAFVSAQQAPQITNGTETAVLSLDAFGLAARELPVGTFDFAESVRGHGDQFRPAGAGAALSGWTVDETSFAASESARRQGISSGDRVLSSASWLSPQELADGLLAVVAPGASLVYVANPDPSLAAKRNAAERITITQ